MSFSNEMIDEIGRQELILYDVLQKAGDAYHQLAEVLRNDNHARQIVYEAGNTIFNCGKGLCDVGAVIRENAFLPPTPDDSPANESAAENRETPSSENSSSPIESTSNGYDDFAFGDETIRVLLPSNQENFLDEVFTKSEADDVKQSVVDQSPPSQAIAIVAAEPPKVKSVGWSKKGKMFKCDECGYKTTIPAILNRHVMSKHTGERPFSCHLCPHKCLTKWNLQLHMRKHDKTRGGRNSGENAEYNFRKIKKIGT